MLRKQTGGMPQSGGDQPRSSHACGTFQPSGSEAACQLCVRRVATVTLHQPRTGCSERQGCSWY